MNKLITTQTEVLDGIKAYSDILDDMVRCEQDYDKKFAKYTDEEIADFRKTISQAHEWNAAFIEGRWMFAPAKYLGYVRDDGRPQTREDYVKTRQTRSGTVALNAIRSVCNGLVIAVGSAAQSSKGAYINDKHPAVLALGRLSVVHDKRINPKARIFVIDADVELSGSDREVATTIIRMLETFDLSREALIAISKTAEDLAAA